MNAASEASTDVESYKSCEDLETVFRSRYASVARGIFRIIQDRGRAEELAVDVFLRWSKTRPIPDGNPEGWLYRAAVRMSLDELRHRSRRHRYEALSRLVRPSPTPEDIRAAEEKQDGVRQVLGSIGRRDAELLLLRNRGFSYEEIASALKLNSASVGTLLSRAQNAFRKEFIKRYGEKQGN